jgi:hypothetical protein
MAARSEASQSRPLVLGGSGLGVGGPSGCLKGLVAMAASAPPPRQLIHAAHSDHPPPLQWWQWSLSLCSSDSCSEGEGLVLSLMQVESECNG